MIPREAQFNRIGHCGARSSLASFRAAFYGVDMIQTSHDRLLIIDFGSQVTQLIARRLRELKVYCEIHPYQNVTADFLAEFAPKAVIFSGGPDSVVREGSPRPPKEVYDLGVPILGICYGQQVMMQDLGGMVEAGESHTAEFGRAYVQPAEQRIDLLNGWFLEGREQVWMSHGDHVSKLAPGFAVYGTSPGAPFAITADLERRFYAVQFHPEVHHTPNGATLYENFIKDAGFTGDWTMGAYREEMIAKIREQVGDRQVICALSGGVDSSVTGILLHEAIGDQLTCVFVDHGLLRLNEAEQVVKMFRDNYNLNLIHADESDLFLGALEGVSDPEVKRKTIGKLFIDVFQKYADQIEGAEFLAQGTLYPDVIESVSFSGGPSVTIKSHHNVGGLPEKMGLKLVEPLRELFKDEVRTLGRELGLPDSFIGRHPFPGPGLAIRCPGEITRDKLEILRKADAVYIDQIRKHGLYDEIWQAFAAILPMRTVGVMGDGRTYDYALALRAVTSVDGMTADYYPFTHEFLGETSTRIINEVKGINRVFYDCTSKPPGTIELE
ncbi:GMP synthase (glutamine-hydrolysing) [Pseudooceanicola antarcticus]|uniref:GMP synthase [glutamine-hydrolyzing] n=2 Tax=Pseudooceanicola antarcticus TaxID=1247613 RepID=A0A285IZD9_9RHOB|nr:GMP synthase (glutamine-hydrolysing) [Pseudooceanicola antarcticus]